MSWIQWYYPVYRIGNPAIADLPWANLTHLAYFNIAPTATGTILDDTGNGSVLTNMAAIVNAWHAAGKKITIVIGGANAAPDTTWRSAVSATYRATFVSNLVTFINTHNLDGIDLDWEPFDTPSDATDYASFIADLRTALWTSKIITLFLGTGIAWRRTFANSVKAHIDRFGLSTYDLSYSSPGFTIHDSPLYGDWIWGQPTGLSADEQVADCIAAGIPASKLNIAMPQYTSNWTWSTGLHTSGTFSSGSAEQYDWLTGATATTPPTWEQYDAVAKAAYIFSGWIFKSYNNVAAVQAKVDYVKAWSAWGIIIWEIGQWYFASGTPHYPLMEPLKQLVRDKRRNSSWQNYSNNADGFSLGWGVEERILTISEWDIELVWPGSHSGTNTWDQSLTNTSDGTSHTVTLWGGTSLKLVEWSNISMVTTGTADDGIVTISASWGWGTSDGDKWDVILSSGGTVYTVKHPIASRFEAPQSNSPLFTTIDKFNELKTNYYGSGTVALDTTVPSDGTGCMKLTLATAGNCWALITLPWAVNFQDKAFSIKVRASAWTNVESAEILLATEAWFSNYYIFQWKGSVNPKLANRPDNEWIEKVFTPGDCISYAGSPNWNAITHMIIRGQASSGTPDVFVDDFKYFTCNQKPFICVSYDDGLLTQYTNGKAKLDQYDIKASFNVIWNELTPGTNLETSHHDILSSQGHDICGHGGTNLTTLSQADRLTDLIAEKKYLLPYKGNNFYAFPNGAYNDAVLEDIRNYFSVFSTIDWLPNTKEYLPGWIINRFSPDAATSTATIQAWIDNAIANKNMAVITWHGIVASGPTGVQVSQATYDTIMDYIGTKKNAWDIDTGTLSDFYSKPFDQRMVNTSDGTSHTVTLSSKWGSLKLVEWSNIALATTGTESDAVVTISSTGGSANNFAVFDFWSSAGATGDSTFREMTLSGTNWDKQVTYNQELILGRGSTTYKLTKVYNGVTIVGNVITIPAWKICRIQTNFSAATEYARISTTWWSIRYLRGNSSLDLTSTNPEATFINASANDMTFKILYATSSTNRPIFWIFIEII